MLLFLQGKPSHTTHHFHAQFLLLLLTLEGDFAGVDAAERTSGDEEVDLLGNVQCWAWRVAEGMIEIPAFIFPIFNIIHHFL